MMFRNKKAFYAILLVLIIGLLGGCGTPKTLAEQAKEFDLKNGANTKVIGKISIVEVNSTEVTEQALLEWARFAESNVGSNGKKYNYAIILFKDKPMNGVMFNGMLHVDVGFRKEKNGHYMMAKQGKIMYEKDGKLVPFVE